MMLHRPFKKRCQTHSKGTVILRQFLMLALVNVRKLLRLKIGGGKEIKMIHKKKQKDSPLEMIMITHRRSEVQ